MTGRIFWLASYPKSGNTWMRLLLANYFVNDVTPVDINSLGWGPIAGARTAFDDYVGINSSDLTNDEIDRLRPRVYEHISQQVAAEPGQDPRFLKVHDAYTLTSDGLPLISKAATAGTIYVLRNPLDVAISYAHHNGSTLEEAVNCMADPAHQLASTAGVRKVQRQLPQRLLTWSQHVTSWVDEPGQHVIPVRYEDMKTSAAQALTDVLHFAGVDPDPDRVIKAAEFSSFTEASKQEADRGFNEQTRAESNFFRSGESGAWRADLPADLVRQVCADHAQVMERFGYLENGEPV